MFNLFSASQKHTHSVDRKTLIEPAIYGILFIAMIAIALFFRPIKGNGESMVYHLHYCNSYKATIIGNHPDDTWFMTEASAQKAGFHKANNCYK